MLTGEEALEEYERDIESRAKMAKRDIDEMTAEAEDSLRETRQRLRQQKAQDAAKRHGQARTHHHDEWSEIAAELAEAAKDREEDEPEEADAPSDRQARRHGHPGHRPEADEEVAEDDRENR